MTQQFSDIMLYKDTSWRIDESVMERYFTKHPIKLPPTAGFATALYRRYVAVLSLKDKELFVDEMLVYGPSHGFHPDTSVVHEVFPEENSRYLKDFTETLLLYGEYVNGGNRLFRDRNEFKSYELLRIVDGRLIDAKPYNHAQLVRFKQEQTEYFKLTDNYQLLREKEERLLAAMNPNNDAEWQRDLEEFSNERLDETIWTYILEHSMLSYKA